MSNYHNLEIKKILEEFKTKIHGLSDQEAQKRLLKYGPNKLSEQKPPGKLTIFFSQFQNVLIYILLVAGVLSILITDSEHAFFSIGRIFISEEVIVIFGAIIINVLLGYFQENKANQALQKLKKMSDHKAFVYREGTEHVIESRYLVPGDIIQLKAGNRVPCDARVIESNELQVNEASLTGESIPAKKCSEVQAAGASLADRKNMVYASTIIVHGEGKAVVVATGENTEIGKIATLVREAKEDKTPLQKRLAGFSRMLGSVFVIICVLIVIVGIYQERGLLDMIETGVAVGVASIPEGLTVAITFILALGMQRILKKKALTRKLVAAETLGSVTVICTDKTGTLTKGEMRVSHIVIGEKEFSLKPGTRQDKGEAITTSLALQCAMMCNDATIENPDEPLSDWNYIGSSTETALLSAAVQSGLRKEALLEIEPQVAKLPFDSEKKFMLSLHEHKNGTYVLYEKGAPEKLLNKSSHYYEAGKLSVLDDKQKTVLIKNYEKMTSRGLRVIAVAIKNFGHREVELNREEIAWDKFDNNLNFIGFIAIKDPLRTEARTTIEEAIRAGIRPVIITGDHKLTAKAIAQEVGLKAKNENILVGEELEKIDDDELHKRVAKVDVFARVSPHHKLRIVNALQSRGEVVAMTGDGINDSPALKSADIGISLGTGTDVAKETSDIVLLDDNFKTITEAVRQGRVIFRNIQKVITFLISDSFSEMTLIVGSLMLGTPLAILPAQILWINIINDGLPHFSLAFEKGDKNIMKNKPISTNEPLINKEMKYLIFGVGIIRDIMIFALFYYMYLVWGNDPERLPVLQTIIFATLGVKSLMAIFSLRHFHMPIWTYSPFSNKYLLSAVAVSFALLFVAIEWAPLQELLNTRSLTPVEWLVPILIGFIGVAMTELVKLKFTSFALKSEEEKISS